METKVTTNIHDIQPTDFPAIRGLEISDLVRGPSSIPEAPLLMQRKYLWMKRFPFLTIALVGRSDFPLNRRSPDWHPSRNRYDSKSPPLSVEFVKAGPRLGWKWTNRKLFGSCETQWLDPEPLPSDEGYEKYIVESKRQQVDVRLYRGFHRPPTQAEHAQILLAGRRRH